MSERRKVLIFTPGGLGGAERMSVLIGKLLPQEKFYVKYVVIGTLRNVYNILPDNYDVDCIPVANRYAFSSLRIWWKIMRERPDVVFSSQASYNPRVIIAAKLARRKIIIRSSGMVGGYSKMKYSEVKFTYRFADLVIAQQEEMREQIINLLNVDSKRAITVHNPIDVQSIDKLANEQSPYSDDDAVRFVNVASVNSNKAQHICIGAFSIVKKNISNAKLYIIGLYDESNEYYKNLLNLVKENELEDSVQFVGFDKNPYRWVKNADCFVFSSREEGFPNSLIEASYLGIPCATTRCLKVMDEIIMEGQNGYVVDVDDIDGLANAMEKSIKIEQVHSVYCPGTKETFSRLFNDIS